MSISLISPSDCCAPCESPEVQEIPGPQGLSAYQVAVDNGFSGTEAEWLVSLEGADGQNAFTLTTADFEQPAVGADVDVSVLNSDWIGVGQEIFSEWGGYYLVIAKADSLTVTLRNRGYDANTPPGFTIPSGSRISAAGEKGEAGADGSDVDVPLTTKGDVLGFDSATARIGVGADGKVLAADSAQALGVGYVTVQPNTATDNGIPRFDGASGKPVPLQDSFVVITDDGALQASGSGGNARGTRAIDLQVSRDVDTQVASGTDSVISGGNKNTASAVHSTVGGGSENLATGLNSTTPGGLLNTASGEASTVGGGQGNVASSLNSTVAGGNSNTSSGATSSSVGGGSNNVASGEKSIIPGGFSAIADLWGEMSHANILFENIGDAQTNEIMWVLATTDATPSEMFLDGISARAVMREHHSWFFRINLIGRERVNGDTAIWEVTGGIKMVGGNVSLVAAVVRTLTFADAGSVGAGWGVVGAVTVTADNTNHSLKIAVTGAAATDIHWLAHARVVEIGYDP